uniref:Uncharacterized protein n=1 Tax=Glossina pallidipes TaxID=7398 RepID=A0A1A9ZVM1_GLOPL
MKSLRYLSAHSHRQGIKVLYLPVVVFDTVATDPTVDYRVWVEVPKRPAEHHRELDAAAEVVRYEVAVVVAHFALDRQAVAAAARRRLFVAVAVVVAEVVEAVVDVAVDHNYSYTDAEVVVADAMIAVMNLAWASDPGAADQDHHDDSVHKPDDVRRVAVVVAPQADFAHNHLYSDVQPYLVVGLQDHLVLDVVAYAAGGPPPKDDDADVGPLCELPPEPPPPPLPADVGPPLFAGPPCAEGMGGKEEEIFWDLDRTSENHSCINSLSDCLLKSGLKPQHFARKKRNALKRYIEKHRTCERAGQQVSPDPKAQFYAHYY